MKGSLQLLCYIFCWILWQNSMIQCSLPPKQLWSDMMEHHNLVGIVIQYPLFSTFIPNLVLYQKSCREHSMAILNAKAIPAYIKSSQINPRLNLISGFSNLIDVFGELYRKQTSQQKHKDFWLIDITDIGFVRIKEQFGGLDISLDDQIFLYNYQHSVWKLYEAYKVDSTHRNVIILDYATWNASAGLMLRTKDGIWERRRDLTDKVFRVQTLESPPYITSMSFNENKSSYEMNGMFAEVFHSLQEIMNFSYILEQPSDGEWGIDKGGNSWTGMVGNLASKQIDIAVTDFTVTIERTSVMTFAEPLIQVYYSFFIKNPAGHPNFEAYTKPLRNTTWLILGLLIIISPYLLYLSVSTGHQSAAKCIKCNTDADPCMLQAGNNAVPRQCTMRILIRFGPSDQNENEFTLAKSLVYCTSVLTFARPWNIVPSSCRGKIAYGSLLVGGTMIYYHWDAMLISFLATRTIVLPFKSLPELMDKTSYKIIVTPGSSDTDTFKKSSDPIWRRAWEERIKPNIKKDLKFEDLINKLISENDLALYCNIFAAKTFGEYTKCEIVTIPQKYDVKPFAYGFQKNSPYLGIFNYYLKQMRERGATKKILEKYGTWPQICPDYSGQPLGFENCFTAFICLLCGFGIACILFTMERLTSEIKEATGFDFPLLDAYNTPKWDEQRSSVLNHDPEVRMIIDLQKAKIKALSEELKTLKVKKRNRRISKNQWHN